MLKDKMPSKGISPIIAAVVLIAITLAIAGVLSFWVSSFVSGRTGAISQQADCAGALDVDLRPPSLTFSDSTLIVIGFNTKQGTVLQNLSTILTYPGGAVRSHSFNLNLGPLAAFNANITQNPTKPLRVRFFSDNCPFLAETPVP